MDCKTAEKEEVLFYCFPEMLFHLSCFFSLQDSWCISCFSCRCFSTVTKPHVCHRQCWCTESSLSQGNSTKSGLFLKLLIPVAGAMKMYLAAGTVNERKEIPSSTIHILTNHPTLTRDQKRIREESQHQKRKEGRQEFCRGGS